MQMVTVQLGQTVTWERRVWSNQLAHRPQQRHSYCL